MYLLPLFDSSSTCVPLGYTQPAPVFLPKFIVLTPESPEALKKKADFHASHALSYIYPIQKEKIEELCSRLFEIGMNQRESAKLKDNL